MGHFIVDICMVSHFRPNCWKTDNRKAIKSTHGKVCVLILKVFGLRDFIIKFKNRLCFCVSLTFLCKIYLKFKLHKFCWRWFSISIVVTKSYHLVNPFTNSRGSASPINKFVCFFSSFHKTPAYPGRKSDFRPIVFWFTLFCTFLSIWHSFHEIPQKTNFNLKCKNLSLGIDYRTYGAKHFKLKLVEAPMLG